MANKMLIDASHPEETRVVVLRGNRVEEFDFESASKKQLRGNIYLAKVTRVEPSLQAAFVDYGGNRHGFLAFSEIHPDYYQIPVVDRQALIEEEARAHRDEDDEEAGQKRSRRRRGDRDGRRAEKRSAGGETLSERDNGARGEDAARPQERAQDSEGAQEFEDAREFEGAQEQDLAGAPDPEGDRAVARFDDAVEREPLAEGEEDPRDGAFAAADDRVETAGRAPYAEAADYESAAADEADFDRGVADEEGAAEGEAATQMRESGAEAETHEGRESGAGEVFAQEGADDAEARAPRRGEAAADEEGEDEDEQVEQLGGDAMEDIPTRPQRYRKQYKIQEVIKRRQVLLVQVVKEERGNKGAALTTYLSLAGRYSVLMPNTARGGGISRKITDSTDRQRLKSIAQELEVPEGMGVILRTAGASRTKPEVKRDFEYLLRMWETVRETTLKSTAPTLVYEEGSLIKRAIRDLYNKDIDDVVVAGETGFREARDFMRLLMPSHVRSVQAYRDPQPIFSKSGVEAQLDAMFLNQVTLKSGGYIVINQTEALVAIDVNSGRSTREHNIEDTALRTNLEASDEIARQLRLRDLAGLIVIDFIDMEEGRNNRAVERRVKDALKNDRARIQVGRISHFGLMEMSRQRIRTGVLEGSTEICPHCSGSGMLRSTASIALHVLRLAEDALIKSASHDLIVRTRTPVALYILNEKRAHLRDLERRFGVCVTIGADDSLIGGVYHALERGEPASGGHEPLALAPPEPPRDEFVESDAADAPEQAFEERDEAREFRERDLQDIEAPVEAGRDDGQDENGDRREGESETDAENRRRRRRRRRRGRGGDREGSGIAANAPQPPDDALEVMARIGQFPPVAAAPQPAIEADAGFAAENEELSTAAIVEAETALIEDLLAVAPAVPEEPQEAPAKTGRRRGRGARASEAAQGAPTAEDGAEPAAGASPEQPAGEAESEGETAPRRGRRTPRARAPRRSSAAAEAESAAPEAEDGAVESASGPLFDRAPEALAEPRPSPAEAPSSTAESSRIEPARIEPAESAANDEPSQETGPDGASAEPQDQDPSRPKRSGWWQRAKASLGR